jgi:hypothetical protein
METRMGWNCRLTSWSDGLTTSKLPSLEPPTPITAGLADMKRKLSTADNLVQRQETSLATNQAQPLIAFQLAFSLGYTSIAPSPTSLFIRFGLMERMGNGMYLR